jgi:hypothetical protein
MDVNEYFNQHVKYETWYSFSEDMRLRAVAQAERMLEMYKSSVDGTIFGYAVAEQALWLLQADKRVDLQQMGVSSFSIGSIGEQFDMKGRPPHIAPQVWAFLRGGRNTGGLKGGSLV